MPIYNPPPRILFGVFKRQLVVASCVQFVYIAVRIERAIQRRRRRSDWGPPEAYRPI